MKVIIYCRVSTKEQAEQGYSLEAQEKDCRKFASDNSYEVDRVFVERGESAKTQNRTELQKLIKYAVENKKKLSGLVIWKYDRLARNLSDQMELVKNFSALQIRVLSVTENNEDTSVGKLMRNIIGSFAQYENDVKSERTRKGMLEAIRQGRWCWPAPIGYKYSRDSLNKPLLIPTDNSRLIKRAFELFNSGHYRQTDLANMLQSEGLKQATKTQVNKILRNCLYAGLIKNKWLDSYVDGLHEPIISKDVFFSVQRILDGKKPNKMKRLRHNPDFPLKGLVLCPTCGRKLTAGWSTGRRNIKYGYYHCPTSGCSINLKKELLEEMFFQYLKSFQPKPEFLDLFEAVVLDAWKTRQEGQTQEKTRLEREIRALEDRKQRIDELVIQGTFDEATYKQKVSQLKDEIMIKTIELNELKIDLGDIEACLNFCKFFLANVAELWQHARLGLKQQFQNTIFPSGIYYEENSFRTKETALIFAHFQAKTKAEYQLVALRGIEPRFDD